MSDRTQGSVRTGETAPAQGTATGQQPAVDGKPSVGSTQTIPGANTARTRSRCVVQQVPTQCPSPPGTDTTAGTPAARAARSTARPHG